MPFHSRNCRRNNQFWVGSTMSTCIFILEDGPIKSTSTVLAHSQRNYLPLPDSVRWSDQWCPRKKIETQSPTHFISKALTGPETCYQKINKEAIAVITSFRKLRRYFLAHTTSVYTNLPLKQVLHRSNIARQVMTWFIEMYESAVSFELRKTLKA